jgi:N-acetylglucosamine kinase-like BadF-type ATPase
MTLPVLDSDASIADHVIGVDIGGTKTHLRAAPADGRSDRPSRDIVLPSLSWRTSLGDFRADGVGLRRLLLDQFGEAALRAPIAVGAHGCDNTEQCRELERELRRHFSVPVLVVNDSELMAPAMDVTSAIGVVVGTGSIATSRTPGGELLTAGGWGWLLGDEGSAPALVREATRAVLWHLDRGDRADALGERLLACFSAVDGAELALTATQVASAEGWGQHAAEVFTAADEGSAIAQLVVANAGERIGGLIDKLLRRGVNADSVVAGGSVIEKQPLLQRALKTALARTRPGLDLHILDRAPVTGAIALARRLAEQTTTNP